ncbi:hypothetical protein B0H63DRAFT_514498 [Podospora didyma]|uniref:Uncharacterized protein n=1 Tax=Podospora didyma TaxID=330526 RepID=A0AAE0K596_9PEZI|nr:hypothetical protein B0H63DRAFT_514498 [Podospora didyma]
MGLISFHLTTPRGCLRMWQLGLAAVDAWFKITNHSDQLEASSPRIDKVLALWVLSSSHKSRATNASAVVICAVLQPASATPLAGSPANKKGRPCRRPLTRRSHVSAKLPEQPNHAGVVREEETRLGRALDDAREELNVSRYHLAEAKANLEKAKGEFQMLDNKELELDGIMYILDNSTRELATLKEKVEPLVEFFQNIFGQIDHDVDVNLETFLRSIVNGIKEGKSADEVEALNISRRSKEVVRQI